MEQPPKVISPPTAPPVGRARRPWRLAVVAGLALVAGAGWYGWRWYTTPVPPAISLDNVEPAVIKAVQAARQQVVEQPRSAEAWGELGMTLEANGFYPQAQVCYAQAEELDPQDRRWPYFLGMLQLWSKGSPGQAAEGLRHLRGAVALSDAQEAFEPRLRLAQALLDLNQKEEAETLLRKLLKERSNFPSLHLNLGQLSYNQGDLKEALFFLRQAVKAKETQKTATRLLAQIYMKLGQPTEAARAGYEEAQMPDDAGWPDPLRQQIDQLAVTREGRIQLAIQLQEQDQYKESLPLLRDLVRDFPGDSRNYLNLGLAHLRLYELDEAEKLFRQALALDPSSVNANYSLGAVFYMRAEREAKRSGNLALLAGGLRAGAPYFQKVVKVKPDHARAHYMLGEWLLKEHQEAKAVKEYQIALRCQPDFPEVQYRLAEQLLAQGQDAAALVHLQHALILAQKDPDRLRLLARLISRSALWK
jgi:tetratricopeptide (TPR) repeat protein